MTTMNIQQALAISNLRVSRKASEWVAKDPTAPASRIAERVFAAHEEQGSPFTKGTPSSWAREWLQSEKFLLLDLPLHFAACPRRAYDSGKVQGCMRAAADSQEPIVVDVNKQRIGGAMGGYYPPVIVVDGVHRHAAGRLQGRETIKAWVGDLAAQALGLTIRADHQFGSSELQKKIQEQLDTQYPKDPVNPYSNRPYVSEVYPYENYFVYSQGGKQYRQSFKTSLKKRTVGLQNDPKEVTQKYVDLEAAAEKVRRRFLKIQASSLEKAMQVFAAGGGGMGGHGGVSTSLSQGSGPPPFVAPATIGTNTKPALQSRGRRKMRGQAKMRPATAGPSMAMKPRFSPGTTPSMKSQHGFVGYRDASPTQSQRMKGGSKSEMTRQLKGTGYYGYQDATDVQRRRMKTPKGSSFSDPKARNKKFNSLDEVTGLKGAADILADASKVSKIWTDCSKAMKAGWKPKMSAVAPPGWEGTVKRMKEHSEITNPWALAWYMKEKGYHPGGKGKEM